MKYIIKKDGIIIYKGEGTCYLGIDNIEIEITE